MTRTETACWSMLASAFVLAALLLVTVAQRGGFVQSAQAEMVLDRGSLTVMTAQTKDDEEAVFVIDNFSQQLLIFKLDLGKRRLEAAGRWPLTSGNNRGGSSGGRSRTPR